MRAYSHDLRTHLLQAVDADVTKAEAARVFGVSVRTIDRYLRQRALTGEVAAKPIPGRQRSIPPSQNPSLEAQLQAHHDATLAQHCELWDAAHGLRVSLATMSRAIARLGWTWKNSRWWPPSATRPSVSSGGNSSRNLIPIAWSSSMRPAATRP